KRSRNSEWSSSSASTKRSSSRPRSSGARSWTMPSGCCQARPIPPAASAATSGPPAKVRVASPASREESRSEKGPRGRTAAESTAPSCSASWTASKPVWVSSPAMSIDPRVDIGHVHLKVSDLDRALAFYRDILGFDLMQRYGDQAAFISAGGYHHHIGLNTWESKGGSPPPRGTTGLYHVAIRYPDRKALAQALKQVVDAGIPLSGATDHGVSEAIYLRDPDDN